MSAEDLPIENQIPISEATRYQDAVLQGNDASLKSPPPTNNYGVHQPTKEASALTENVVQGLSNKTRVNSQDTLLQEQTASQPLAGGLKNTANDAQNCSKLGKTINNVNALRDELSDKVGIASRPGTAPKFLIHHGMYKDTDRDLEQKLGRLENSVGSWVEGYFQKKPSSTLNREKAIEQLYGPIKNLPTKMKTAFPDKGQWEADPGLSLQALILNFFVLKLKITSRMASSYWPKRFHRKFMSLKNLFGISNDVDTADNCESSFMETEIALFNLSVKNGHLHSWRKVEGQKTALKIARALGIHTRLHFQGNQVDKRPDVDKLTTIGEECARLCVDLVCSDTEYGFFEASDCISFDQSSHEHYRPTNDSDSSNISLLICPGLYRMVPDSVAFQSGIRNQFQSVKRIHVIRKAKTIVESSRPDTLAHASSATVEVRSTNDKGSAPRSPSFHSQKDAAPRVQRDPNNNSQFKAALRKVNTHQL